jgi:hypothetical protein
MLCILGSHGSRETPRAVEGSCGHGDEHLYSAVDADEVKRNSMMLVG